MSSKVKVKIIDIIEYVELKMKIIGIVERDVKFIVEISQHELNKLSGKNIGGYNNSEYYIVGQEFEIQKTWDYLELIMAFADVYTK